MQNTNKEEKFSEEVFSYKSSKDKKIFIYWYSKQVMILKGKESEKFLARIANTDFQESQLIMAKVTGNFKRGNEKKK
jgi:hypothetical protein